MEGQGQPSQALGVGRHLGGVVFELRCRDLSFQDGLGALGLRWLHGASHGPDVRNGPADLGRGHRQPEIIPGLQQNGLGLHQPLAHRPIGGLPEVSAFGVL